MGDGTVRCCIRRDDDGSAVGVADGQPFHLWFLQHVLVIQRVSSEVGDENEEN